MPADGLQHQCCCLQVRRAIRLQHHLQHNKQRNVGSAQVLLGSTGDEIGLQVRGAVRLQHHLQHKQQTNTGVCSTIETSTKDGQKPHVYVGAVRVLIGSITPVVCEGMQMSQGWVEVPRHLQGSLRLCMLFLPETPSQLVAAVPACSTVAG